MRQDVLSAARFCSLLQFHDQLLIEHSVESPDAEVQAYCNAVLGNRRKALPTAVDAFVQNADRIP